MPKVKYNSKNFQKYIDQKDVKVRLLSPYKDLKTKITCQCRKCDHKWDALPGNLLKGHSCKKCGHEKAIASRRGSLERIQQIIDSYGLNIFVSGMYKTQESILTCYCINCNSQWESQAKQLIAKIRKGKNPCCVCNKIDRHNQTAASFFERVKSINPDVKIITPYIRTDVHVQCECLICGHTYPVLPLNLLKGRRCPQCALQKASERLRDTHSTFLKKLATVNTDIEVIGEYVNQDTQIECVCTKCGNVWFPVPYHLLSGVGCPDCQQSRGEKYIQAYLMNNGIQYETQKRFPDCRYRYTLAFDFYIPARNMCIEFDGIQHYKPVEVFGGDEGFEETQIRDKIKEEYCKEKGVLLLRIPYYEKDIEAALENALKFEIGFS